MKKMLAKSEFPGSPRSARRVHTISGIVLNYEGNSDLTYVRSPDVSARGMFINSAKTFPEGAVLNVRFRLALTGAEVRARGEVRYSLPGVGIGLEFVGLDAATLEILEREVEYGTLRKRSSGKSPRSKQKTPSLRRALSKRHKTRR
jgi:hypothetical protein